MSSAAVVIADPALPQLHELLDRDAMSELLSDVCASPTRVEGIDIVRHRAGRRCTLRYVVHGDRGADLLYAKTYASDRHGLVWRTVRALAETRAFGPCVAVPEPVAHVPGLHLVVQRGVAGEPVTDRLIAGDEKLAERVAAALYALHSSGVELEREHRLADELVVVERRLAELPDRLRADADGCLHASARAAAELPWRRVSIHRDLYHDQVLVDGDRLGVLDLDDATMSEPAVDIANFSAHLRLLHYEGAASSWPLRRVAEALRSRYVELGGTVEQRLVEVLEATTLLRLTAIHLPRCGEQLAERLIACSRNVLRGSDGW